VEKLIYNNSYFITHSQVHSLMQQTLNWNRIIYIPRSTTSQSVHKKIRLLYKPETLKGQTQFISYHTTKITLFQPTSGDRKCVTNFRVQLILFTALCAKNCFLLKYPYYIPYHRAGLIFKQFV